MARTNQRNTSAVQHRSPQNKTRKVVRKANRGSWVWIGVILGSVALIVGVLLYVYFTGNTSNVVASDPAVFNTITHVDPTLLQQVGTGNAQSTLHAVKNAPPLKGPMGKPEFFYVGGEFCPYCAAQRWAIVVALSRFGSFSPLSQTHSSEQNLATLTFHKSTYTSQYIDFVAKEVKDNQNNSLDPLSSDQQHIFDTYNAPPYIEVANSIPFIDIANQRVSAGSYYLPDTLTNHSWQDVATQMKQPGNNVSKGILGSANYLTAAICVATQNNPTSVCGADYMQQIEKTL
ncbi:MAG: hypothetical protein NVSMB38_40660 [Ktedonobacteraceae bacterium]